MNTVFPVISIALLNSHDDQGYETARISQSIKTLCIITICVDFLTSFWGLLLAIPVDMCLHQFAVAASKLDHTLSNSVVPMGFSVAAPRADSNLQPNESSILHDYQGNGVPVGGTGVVEVNTKAARSVMGGNPMSIEPARPYVPPPMHTIDGKLGVENNIDDDNRQ